VFIKLSAPPEKSSHHAVNAAIVRYCGQLKQLCTSTLIELDSYRTSAIKFEESKENNPVS
jgi:heterodisulfide reductase subunit A-like polyferredoxin